MIVRRVVIVCLIAAAAVGKNSFAQSTCDDSVRPFLRQHCFECHGVEQQESGLRLDALSTDIDTSTIDGWRSVLKVLTNGDMPPADQPEPNRAKTEQVVTWLRNKLAHAEAELRDRQPLRRLDRDEYRNTIRDLLELDVSLFDPTREFPMEVGPAGREVVSLESLTGHYLSAANAVIERAIHTELRPHEETHVFRGWFAMERSLCAELLGRSDCETLLVGPNQQQSELMPKQFKGTSAAGHHRIRIKATACDPPQYFNEIKGIEKGEPLRLTIEFFKRTGRTQPPRAYAGNAAPTATKVFELNRDGQTHDYEWNIWLEPSMLLRLSFANGPTERPSEVWVMKNFPGLWKYPDAQAADHTPWRDSMLKILMDRYQGPMIHVHEISIMGPIHEQWPPRSHKILMSGDDSVDPSNGLEERLRQFAERAFRRPVKRDEIKSIVTLVRTLMANGESPFDAMKSGFKAILCSPMFLFFVEPQDRLDNYALASRLSYFLWSTMPDKELLQLAAAGRLTDPKVRKQQTGRMLADPKSAAFVQRFSDRWLNLDRPDIAPPDPRTFPLYYQRNLGYWSRMETQRFFRHILSEDRSIANFIDSDFVFANYELSKLYDLPNVSGRSLRKVRLEDSRRGGLLGQASVMTATSTGPETSPILRGVWVLKSLLGDPPAPPPPNVPSLEPDLRGSTTLRERLEKHRSSAACNACHQQIDPLGFPLEAYDRIGKWRAAYAEHNQQIDTTGTLPDGDSFEDVAGLKKVLLTHKDQFTRRLTEKLIEYARGRPVGVTDEFEIDAIVKRLQQKDYGMQQLLYLVVQNDLFLRK